MNEFFSQFKTANQMVNDACHHQIAKPLSIYNLGTLFEQAKKASNRCVIKKTTRMTFKNDNKKSFNRKNNKNLSQPPTMV